MGAPTGHTVACPRRGFWVEEHACKPSLNPSPTASQKLSKTNTGSSGDSWPRKQSRHESQTAPPIPANKKDISYIRHFTDTLMRANKGCPMQIRECRKAAPRSGTAGCSQPSRWVLPSCSWGTPLGASRGPRPASALRQLHEAETLLWRVEPWGSALPNPHRQL